MIGFQAEYIYKCYIFVPSTKDINMKTILLVATLFICINLSAQQVHDFTVTDTDGVVHNIYTDHLDQGQTVVLKVFFVACPPCNAIAPSVQELYEDWGEGDYDVEFFEITTNSGDDNSDVQGYKTKHSITFPGVSADGNAAVALQPFKSGTYGTFYGTPSFAVIAPDGSIDYGTGGSGISCRIAALNDAIAATGAQGAGNSSPEQSIFKIDVKNAFNESIDNLELTLESADGSVSYDIDPTKDLSIEDLNVDYPNIVDPFLRIKKTDEVAKNTSALDLFIIVRHILGKEAITDNFLKLASDTNGDGTISALDLFSLQRIILGKDLQFPNSNSYEFIPSEVKINLDPGKTQNLNFVGVKIGDLNGY